METHFSLASLVLSIWRCDFVGSPVLHYCPTPPPLGLSSVWYSNSCKSCDCFLSKYIFINFFCIWSYLLVHHVITLLERELDVLGHYKRGPCDYNTVWKCIQNCFFYQPLIIISKVHGTIVCLHLIFMVVLWVPINHKHQDYSTVTKKVGRHWPPPTGNTRKSKWMSQLQIIGA